MTKLATQFKTLLNNESGTTSIEYAVMLALIVAVCIVGITTLGGSNGSLWSNNSSEITNALK